MRVFSLIRSYSSVIFGLCLFSIIALDCSIPSTSEPPHMKMRVDLRNVRQGIFHAELHIPCTPGTVSLHYPKWIPGEHSPNGPITQLVNLQFNAMGQPAAWQRDPDDMYAFHCTVPDGASMLDVTLDYLSPSAISGPGYGYSPNSTGRLFTLLWYSVLLYPEAESTGNIMCDASLRMPAGWRFASALAVQSQGNDTVAFEPVSLSRLVDSPVMGGENFRSIPLSDQKAPVTLDIVADSPEDLEVDTSQVMLYRNMVSEVDSLFGVRHFHAYTFLISLSDLLDVDGVEHHESTDIRLPERALVDTKIWKRRSYLLPHEYVHSWNGKHKRPLGLVSANFQEPVQTDLLWVYEGLTRYLDVILTGRSGLRTAEEVRDYLAWAAGYLDHDRPGRNWRSLHDVSESAQLLYSAPDEWLGWRRGWMDIYDEGALIWLEADVTIRRLSGGQHSLDDFCRSFFGGKPEVSRVERYTLDDVVKALDKIVHNDWQKFFSDRVNGHEAHAPLGGITNSGWDLEYSESANSQVSLREDLEGRIDATWSIGLSVFDNGVVQDAIPGSPGFQAGVSPGMKILKINGKNWSLQALRNVIAGTKDPQGGFDLTLQQGRREVRCRIDYHDGTKYPHLKRAAGKADVLEKILAQKRQESDARSQ